MYGRVHAPARSASINLKKQLSCNYWSNFCGLKLKEYTYIERKRDFYYSPVKKKVKGRIEVDTVTYERENI